MEQKNDRHRPIDDNAALQPPADAHFNTDFDIDAFLRDLPLLFDGFLDLDLG
jgi:hypothetical protein